MSIKRSVNVPLLRKTLEKVESLPELGKITYLVDGFHLLVWDAEAWDQKSYKSTSDYGHCGTAFCFAGWAVMEAGQDATKMCASEIEASAREHLGIDFLQSSMLFSAYNNKEDLRIICARLAYEAGDEL